MADHAHDAPEYGAEANRENLDNGLIAALFAGGTFLTVAIFLFLQGFFASYQLEENVRKYSGGAVAEYRELSTAQRSALQEAPTPIDRAMEIVVRQEAARQGGS